jgi:hypothetical protein
MPPEMIVLKGKAATLGIEGFRTMSKDELKAAINRAQKGTDAPAKGKGKGKATTDNGAKGKTVSKGKGKTAATPQKGKGAPAKSTRQKSSPPKGKATAAKGTAKRATAKRSTAKRATAKRATAKRNVAVGRVEIDRTAIDWTLDSRVGASGKRKEVRQALRKYKGNYDKCFDLLKDKARKWYPQHDKHNAQKMLRWLINRVAYDYVMATEQHEPGERAGYGKSKNPSDIARREKRAAAAKAAAKAARPVAKRTAAKRGSTKRKTAKRGSARKGK